MPSTPHRHMTKAEEQKVREEAYREGVLAGLAAIRGAATDAMWDIAETYDLNIDQLLG